MISYEPLRILMAQRKIRSARELARLTGVSPQTCNLIYSLDKPVNLKNIEKICIAMNVRIEEVVTITADN